MNVFITWSGDRSHRMALAVKGLLEVCVHGPRYWISDDLPDGSLWRAVLQDELAGSNFGIACVTPENRESRWLHFEAGAIAKATTEHVRMVPLLLDFDPEDLEDPLASFQAKRVAKESVRGVARAIARENGFPDVATLDSVFAKFWPDLETELKEIADSPEDQPVPPGPSESDKLDEILVRVRRLERLPETPPASTWYGAGPFKRHGAARGMVLSKVEQTIADVLSETHGKVEVEAQWYPLAHDDRPLTVVYGSADGKPFTAEFVADLPPEQWDPRSAGRIARDLLGQAQLELAAESGTEPTGPVSVDQPSAGAGD